MPVADLVIKLTVRDDETRDVCLTANSPLGTSLLAAATASGGGA
jgi:hypothetical protein